MLLRQLSYLVALAKERHFARAAASCNITQPALSAAIRHLEEELGVMLVERDKRFNGFTPEGQEVLLWARRMLGGAARGAALGAIGGAIAGDAGEGAAIGAAVGGTAGLMRRNQQRRQQAYANDQAMAQYKADLGRYNQALAACMQGRGYVVR